MTRHQWRPFVLFSLLAALALAASDSTPNHEAALVRWLRERDGIFSEKLEIRRADPEDSSSRYGVFATQDIEISEILLSVPSDSFFTSGWKEDHDEDDEDYEKSECDIIWNLIHEMRMGDKSEFAPYLRYLLEQSYGQLPSTWSEAGKELLEEVLGVATDEGIPPSYSVDLIDEWSECVTVGDAFEENAAMMVVQRGWDDILIPVYDMFSHRNGRWLNTEDDGAREGDGVDVSASREIKEGEEIYMSYNFCTDCGSRALTYGTPQILRDYGFVEQMPQRWIFKGINVSFDLNEEMNADGSGSGKLELSWLNREPSDEAIDFFSAQLQRLKYLAQTDFEDGNGVMPKHEWDVIWQYHQALMVALTHAIKAALGEDEDICNGEENACSRSDRYDSFHEEEDELEYSLKTCDNEEIMRFEDYENIAEIKSAYQTIFFVERQDDKDMCFDLDNTVQMCSSYRPHYHETVVHFSARYIENVRRVVFVGGGDSMILHEVLKYPSLELVVGLELDQKVTRHSFKHFKTQPHFDDERVEWWFGDATKSLLMLPKDFFGSFDLVLVDLSETVMSFLVTEELDVLEALALLLKPNGVFVKNELYLEKMSQIFDHTIQLNWQKNPVICSQCLIMGSNQVDFLQHTLTDHNIKNLHLKPLDIDDHFGLIHDYRQNFTDVPGMCQEPNKPKEKSFQQAKTAGILMIVDAEDATAAVQPLKEIERVVFAALEKEGLTPTSTVATPSNDKRTVAVIMMREGYVVVRPWPEHKYVAIDINLWGGFKNIERVRSALIAAVGSSSGSSSSYRIVVGGMIGSRTWRNDQKTIGPRITQTCDPEAKSGGDNSMDQSAIDMILEESMDFVQNKEAVVAVLCGSRDQSCKSLDVLAGDENARKVIALWTCPVIKDDNEYAEDDATRMFACEKDTLNVLKESVVEKEKVGAFIIDPSAPIAMAKIVHKILSREKHKREMLMPDVMFMAMMLDKTELWRRNFLERFRQILEDDPLSRAEIIFKSPDSSMEMGFTTSGDSNFFIHLLEVTNRIKNRSGLDVDIHKIQGGLWNFQPDFDPRGYSFLQEDYDLRDSELQYSTQQPLGHQTVFQLECGNEIGDGKEAVISTFKVKDALDITLSQMNFNIQELEVFVSVGDGCAIVAVLSEGSVVIVWNGDKHIDINLFTYTENVIIATQVANRFMKQFPTLKILLRDEQPRGIGRVINFIEDIDATPIYKQK